MSMRRGQARDRVLMGLVLASICAVLVSALELASPSVPAGAESGDAPTLQRTAEAVRPAPNRASTDRGRLFEDGCMVDQSEMRFPTCVYGRPRSKTTVVLFGDSQAMHYFPALVRLAERRGWRLVGRTRRGCVPASIRFSHRCDKWRRETLRRIVRRDRPDLVVVGSGVAYRPIVNGRRLGDRGSQPVLAAGYARTLRRLRRTGARVAVMKATPWAPADPPDCVARSMRRLRRCAFARRQPTNRAFDAEAARRVGGARLVDATPALCRRRICPAVIDDLLVYRDRYHLSATFARTLAPWLGRRLPAPR